MGAPGIRRIMIGTAGHIDHGKSSLVRALTGIDPVHLKEEKERGLTIDLGRATLPLPDGRLVGILDVPGHERFLKNMVAGATSVDLALLVVAADDGVMPQTREHLEILALLGVGRLLVALTKVDLVADPELLALARDEVVECLAGTPFAGSTVVPVSAVTGEGLERLRGELVARALEVEPRPPTGLFRMPMQRIFLKEGFGAILGGVPVAGLVRQGESVEVLPAGIPARIRGIQAYGREVDEAAAGYSCALNLPAVPPDQVHRGAWVVAPGVFRADRQGWAHVRLLPGSRPLRAGAAIRVHLGTAELLGRVYLPSRAELSPGAGALALLRLDEPTLLVPGDRFLLRLQEEPHILGGGHLLLPWTGGRRRARGAFLASLERMHAALVGGEPAAFLEEVVRAGQLAPLSLAELARYAARDLEATRSLLDGLQGRGRVVAVGRDYLHHEALAGAMASAGQELRRRAEREPLSPEVGQGELASASNLAPPVLEAALEGLRAQGVVELLAGGRVRLAGSGREPEGQDRLQTELLLQLLAAAGCQPLTEEEARERSRLDPGRCTALLKHLLGKGQVVRVGGVFLFHQESFQRARQALVENCRAHGGALDLPSFRDEIGTSRKYVIPLLEHFDGLGLTARRGSTRVLRRGAAGS